MNKADLITKKALEGFLDHYISGWAFELGGYWYVYGRGKQGHVSQSDLRDWLFSDESTINEEERKLILY